jgi:hypothetical protein
MTKRRTLHFFIVPTISLALAFSFLALVTSQPSAALTKFSNRDVMRQTSPVGETSNMTGTASMDQASLREMVDVMTHVGQALDKIQMMHQMQMINQLHMTSGMGMTGTTGMNNTLGMNNAAAMTSVGPMIDSMGHVLEAISQMHEMMAVLPSASTDNMTDMAGSDTMTTDLVDMRAMLDIMDQLLQATISQMQGMTNTTAGALGATAPLTDTTTVTDTAGTGDTGVEMNSANMMGMHLAGMGMLDPGPMLPLMAQTAQTTISQLRTMLDAMDPATGSTGNTDGQTTNAITDTGSLTDTAGTGATGDEAAGTDSTGTGAASIAPMIQMMGKAMETIGHMHMLMATMNTTVSMSSASGMPEASATGTDGASTMGAANLSEMTGLMSQMVQVITTHLDTITNTTGIAVSVTDTTAMTDTANADTMGAGAMASSADGAHAALGGVAQLLRTTLQQLQTLIDGMGNGMTTQ